uniref:Uncharacterized protein n=1 Tax=Panagrolaimus sp. PS1159 TaxID=55785 RepID=A0AC35GFC6_9BILA
MLSVLASILIVYKVAKQAKFQLKHNRKDFINSVRITAVICLQLILNIFSFLIEGIRLFYALASALGIKYFDNTIYSSGLNLAGYLDFRIPLWLDYSYGLSSVFPRLMIIQIRIFIESLIVLFIMTGYREVIENVVKYIYRIIRHPRKNFKDIKTFISGSNSTTPISVY